MPHVFAACMDALSGFMEQVFWHGWLVDKPKRLPPFCADLECRAQRLST
jgi:hypothetical protein